jgi:hypothetical protein
VKKQKISPGKGRTLIRVAEFFAFVLMAGTMIAVAETPDGVTAAVDSPAANPAAQVRQDKSWEYGPFVNYGNGVGGDERSQYKFLWAGFQLSKVLSPVVHSRVFPGQFEFGGSIMPLWQSYTPAPHLQNYKCISPVTGQPYTCPLLVGGGTFRGVSIMPVILRWNFLTRARRVQPWFQGAGALIYTTHKFPPHVMSTPPSNGLPGIDGGTCVWNFAPQGGFGIHYFTRARRSIDLGVNGVHISSASLGDRNPGVNASVQVQLGYTFWK